MYSLCYKSHNNSYKNNIQIYKLYQTDKKNMIENM